MELLSEENIRARLLDFLSSLQNVSTVAQRQTFVDSTGIDWLAKQIIWEGNTLTFFGGLLRLLAQDNQASLLEFLTTLAKSSYVSFEQRERLALLYSTLISFTPEQQDRAFTSGKPDIQGIIKQCQKASVLEMKVVGSKYIAELYFPRLQIETNFKHFLTSDSTCFLIVAKAGRGKTNLLCYLTEELQNQHPILFLSGRVEPKDSNGILVHIASRLGYGENWLACFKKLSLLANKGLVPLIMIDGINESATPPKTMQAALRELLFQAYSYKVKVCVACRTEFWKFYRASFWEEYSWRDPIFHVGKMIIGQDLPFFQPEDFDHIVSRYFNHFHIQGRLVNDAWERCRNPLLLRFFCEAYHGEADRYRDIGEISQIRLYPLFSFFWDRKIENIQDVAGLAEPYPIHKLILNLARLMYQRHQTKVPKEAIAKEVKYDLIQPDSLYLRVLDEEIILEEELDELLGNTNVIFVYDKFSEYAIALSIFSDRRWLSKSVSDIITDAISLMKEETQQRFTTLRGALEFMVLRMEDRRQMEGIHFSIINAMLNQDWKWRWIGTMLAFQLTRTEEKSYWTFVTSLTHDKRDLVRRICVEQLPQFAHSHPDYVVPLLVNSLQDASSSVRQATKASLLSLEAAVAGHAAHFLLSRQLFQFSSFSLVAEVLLWPMDSYSPLLQEKAIWLVDQNSNGDIQQAIFAYLTRLGLPAYKDLYALEELEQVFQIDSRYGDGPDNSYLKEIRQHLTSRKATLRVDVQRLDTLRLTVQQLLDCVMQVLNTPPPEQEVMLYTELQVLLPDIQQQRVFLHKLKQKFDRPLQHVRTNQRQQEAKSVVSGSMMNQSLRIIDLAFEIAHSTPIFAVETQEDCLVNLFPSSYSSLIRLCQIADDVVKEATNTVRETISTITLDTVLGIQGLNLQLEECLAFRDGYASKIGVEMSAMEHRALSTLGRLSFWLWQAEIEKQRQEQALEKKVREMKGLTIDGLHSRLSTYEVPQLSQDGQHELCLELQALCKIYASSFPMKIAEALTLLVVWAQENDSQILNQAFQTLYWEDRNSFWVASETLLEHEDRRVVDFASQVLEQAEYTEEQNTPSGVLDRLRSITVNQLGIDPFEVTPGGFFAEDLNAGSLDFVDLTVSVDDVEPEA